MVANPTRPPTAFVRTNGVDLAYESIGDASSPPLLLIAGLGGQLVSWPLEFCRRLAEQGFFIVRFDNRDAGLSTRMPAGYSLSDMADDVSGLIDTLAIESAHIVGQSLGGLIAQNLVVRHPERVRSLALLSSTPSLMHFAPAGIAEMSTPRPSPRGRDEAIDQFLAREAFFAGPGYPPDVELGRELAGVMWDRGWNAEGTARQMAALIGAGDFTALLRSVNLPTVIIHGDADPLINPTAARALADTIPGAELHLVPGMGHQLPAARWAEFVKWIATNADKRASATEGVGGKA